PADDGALRIRVVDRLGRPADLSVYSLRTNINGIERFVANSPPIGSTDQVTDEPLRPDPQREGEGIYFLPNLEPRRYELHVRGRSQSKVLTVDSKARETTTIDVRLDE